MRHFDRVEDAVRLEAKTAVSHRQFVDLLANVREVRKQTEWRSRPA